MFDCDNYFSLESDYKSWPPSSLYDRFQPSGGYHVAPPLYTGTFMPLPVETFIPTTTPMPTSPKSNSSGKRRDRKACLVCKSVDHLIKDCDYHAKKMSQPTSMNYTHRGNHKQYASFTHTNPQKHMVPPTVFTQTKPISFTPVSPVSAVVPKINVTRPKYVHLVVTKSKSPIRRHITRNPSPKTSNSPPRVTVAMAPVVSAAQGMHGKWGNPQHALKDKRVIDGGCSRHMTGNMSYLSDFEELNGGYIAFGGGIGAEADSNNLETSITVSPILTIRVHKDHHVSQIIGSGPTWLFDIDSLTMTMNYQPVTAGNQTHPVWSSGLKNPQNNDGDAAFDGKEHDFDAKKPEIGVEADFNNLETSITEEPKRVHQAFKDPSWIEAMQEELFQFKMQKEEEIDYEEVFPPVARIEAIRLFLAYASFMGFMVYQTDIKSAFLYRTIEKEVFVCQPPGFKDPEQETKRRYFASTYLCR
nr:hypothetical protein [Tanacetum cinerariifolium]